MKKLSTSLLSLVLLASLTIPLDPLHAYYSVIQKISGSECFPVYNDESTELIRYTTEWGAMYSADTYTRVEFFCPIDSYYLRNYTEDITFSSNPKVIDEVKVHYYDPTSSGGDDYNLKFRLCFRPFSTSLIDHKCSSYESTDLKLTQEQ